MSSPPTNSARAGVLRRYRDRLPVTDATPMLYLGEGETPLALSRRLAERVGCERLYFKLEMCNPTGSFKDRGMVVAVAKAVEEGARAVLCASTGNTSASAAAYAAHCGLDAFVLVPRGNIAQGKLAQAVAHGARVLAIDGNFDAALQIAREVSRRHPVAIVNSVNWHRIEGQKTAAFEIVDALGAAPIVRGHPVDNPETVASAIRIGNPASWKGAMAARDESGGAIDAVTDEEILEAYRLLAQEEGIFAEPASAACVAGLLKYAAHPEPRAASAERESKGLAGKTVVCVITGHGLKDPDTALSIQAEMTDVPADTDAVVRAMGL